MPLPIIIMIAAAFLFLVAWPYVREFFTKTIIPGLRERLGNKTADLLAKVIFWIDTPTTQLLEHCLRQHAEGDPGAGEQLLTYAYERLRRLTGKMLQSYPDLQNREGTTDVLHNAYFRLRQALTKVKPESVLHFFHLASQHIRWELLELARQPLLYQERPVEPGGTDKADDTPQLLAEQPDLADRPSQLAVWGQFHAHVEALPDAERKLFDLLWYQELSQAEAAALLGVSVRTVKRRWQEARLKLFASLKGELPGL